MESFPCAAELRLAILLDGSPLPSAVWIKASPLTHPGSDLPEELALFDTGAAVTILSRQWAQECGVIPFTKAPTQPMHSRRGQHLGEYVPVRFTLVASEGKPLAWESEAWISDTWDGPSVIGWRGVLNHLRFHLDPGSCVAHFDLI